ncbi:MAG: DUF3276 family protein [Bacteroidales bacterium]
MMEGYENKEEQGKNGRDIIFSKVIRAGKRTYFLDVKATRNDDYYLTITESKKRFKRNGKRFFEKHKVFLYKEDFDKFTESLEEVINFIKTEKGYENEQRQDTEEKQEQEGEVTVKDDGSYTSDVEFEDLDENKE